MIVNKIMPNFNEAKILKANVAEEDVLILIIPLILSDVSLEIEWYN